MQLITGMLPLMHMQNPVKHFKKELLGKTSFESLTILAKSSMLDICQGCEYVSELHQQWKVQKTFKSRPYLASSKWGVIFLFLWNYSLSKFFFQSRFSFTNIHDLCRTVREGEAISLTPFYQFHPLRRHLDITQLITAENSPLHMAGSWFFLLWKKPNSHCVKYE